LLDQDHPGIIKLYKKRPGAFFNKLPLEIHGYKVNGLSLPLYPFLRHEVMGALKHFDVIHYLLPIYFLESTLRINRSLVVEVQNTDIDFFTRRFMKAAMKRGAFFNFASDALRKRYSKALDGKPFQRSSTSPCSFIDYDKTFIGQKENIISFVGRMETVKNPLVFVDAICRVRRKREDFRAYMLGTGRMEKHVDRRICDLGLQDFVIRRFDPFPQNVLSRTLVFLSLQAHDNYHSQSLMEAMACGCAVIASDVGETWRLVSDGVGFRVQMDPEVISKQILFLLDHREKAMDMGRAAREKVMNEHNISVYGAYLEGLYGLAYEQFLKGFAREGR
jgi:glycosyltransferase involved in cell wall biosynthesis